MLTEAWKKYRDELDHEKETVRERIDERSAVLGVVGSLIKSRVVDPVGRLLFR